MIHILIIILTIYLIIVLSLLVKHAYHSWSAILDALCEEVDKIYKEVIQLYSSIKRWVSKLNNTGVKRINFMENGLLESAINKALANYTNQPIDIYTGTFLNVPNIEISFIPTTNLSPNDLNILSHTILCIFQRHMKIYHVIGKSFVHHATTSTGIKINIYYEELPCDEQPFKELYLHFRQLQMPSKNAPLRDKHLEKELKDFDNEEYI